jgi:ankyrin repeat protein
MLSTGSDLIQKCKDGDVAANADVNALIYGESPFSAAVGVGNLDLLHLLLQAGADPVHVSEFGRTPLMIAAQRGHLEIVQCLLQRQPSAVLNARDEDGNTALLLAVNECDDEIASALLDAGADATWPMTAPRSSLHVSTSKWTSA